MSVPGEGPTPCAYMFIGEYPGVEEVRVGRPFVGKSGQELRRYLNGYSLPEADDIYLTNLKKELHDPKKPYVLSAEDEQTLWREIRAVRPQVIVTLGSHVTKYFLDDGATLEATYGIAHQVLDWSQHPGDIPTFMPEVTIFPSYNPAAMLHSPKMQAWFADGMKRLELFLKGQLPPAPVDDGPGTYMDISSGGAWDVVGKTLEGFDVLSCDTEGWTYKPWGASVSGEPYIGYVAKAGTDGWKRLREHIARTKVRLRIHNSLHDLGVLRAMDLDLDALEVPYDDTMVQAYLLGLEPQGLKPLAKRHAGMEQSEYSDIVAVPNARIAEQWLHDLVERLPSVTVYNNAHMVGVCGCGKVHKAAAKVIGKPFTRTDKAELSPDDKELARVRGLVEKMLAKNEPTTLRKRWSDGRAREILVDELYYLDPFHADPPDATLDDIDEHVAVRYSGRDADATTRVAPPLSAAIDAMGLRDVYNADMGALPMIDRMQTVGLDADLAHFKSLSDLFAVERELNREAIRAMVGRDLNPNSGDQVAELLYGQLKLDRAPGAQHMRIKRTDSGSRLSTNDKILEALSTLHPVVELIQDGREIGKMDGTYARPMVYLIGQDGRLHPRYRITQTDTGRLSAADPNVLALPKHTARGKLVRMGFRAGPGRVLSEWDLSQIEMCVFAHDSNDERMLAEIRSGTDKHAATAATIFNRPAEVIYAEHKAGVEPGLTQRFAAKAVNFGILMGITPFGLLDQFHKNKQMHWTMDMTEDLLHDWMRAYPQAATYIELKHAEARRYGFVRDMWGRLRWLEGIHSYDDYIRAEAERQAQATPTQSGAQGIIKRSMGALWPILKDFRRQGMWVEALLQVHDALVLEHDPKDTAVINDAVMMCLTEVVTLKVPIKAAAHTGVLRLGEL